MAFVAELLAKKIQEFELKSPPTNPVPTATRDRLEKRRTRLEHIRNLSQNADGSINEGARQACLEALTHEVYTRKNMEALMQRSQREAKEISKEHERLSAELTRAIQGRTRTELSCKELQKRQRVLEEENARISGSEEKRRLELEASCQSTIDGVKLKMEQHQSEQSVQQGENVELQKRFDSFLQKYEEREKVLEEQEETRVREMTTFRQRLSERDALQAKERVRTDELQEENTRLSEVETDLRAQLQSYAERFNELQSALQTSNDGFESYKSQMDELQQEMNVVRTENDELQATIKRGPQVKKQLAALTKLLETLRTQNNPETDPPIGTSTSSSSRCAPEMRRR